MVIRLRKAHFMSVMWEHGEVIGCTTRILKEGLWNQGIHRYTYIMVDTEFDVRWMTDEESWEYVKEKDMRLMMEEYAKFDNKKKYEQIYEIQGNGSNRGSMPDGSGLQTETQGGVAGD